jgi:hypothetical protein
MKTSKNDYLGIVLLIFSFIIVYLIVFPMYKGRMQSVNSASSIAELMALSATVLVQYIYFVIKDIVLKKRNAK